MSRLLSSLNQSRLFLRLAVIVLLLLAVPKIKYTSWVGWFGDKAQLLFAPIGHPVSLVVNWVRGPGRRPADNEQVAKLDGEVKRLRTLYLQAEAENERLRALLFQTEIGKRVNPNLSVKQITAGVYSSASDVAGGVLRLRAGDSNGVLPSSIATADGIQLLGRVIDISDRTCAVVPITAKNAGLIKARIMLDETANGIMCGLAPVGNGTLRGDIINEPNRPPVDVGPIVGQDVRLDDRNWPAAAQMLIVGRVETVENSPSSPGRKRVIVRPTVDKMELMSEVILRITPAAPEDAPTGGVRK